MARLTKPVTFGPSSQKKKQTLRQAQADALGHYRGFRGLSQRQLYNDAKGLLKNESKRTA